jgi:hypothetical protein
MTAEIHYPNYDDRPTGASFTREDFTVRSEHGFRYPFEVKQLDFSDVPNHPWPGSLPEADRDELGIYTKPGFDLAAEVAKIPGPIVEMAGPSTRGYTFLHNVDLPSKPFITNYRGNGASNIEKKGTGANSITPLDQLVLSALADVRAFPVADESVGMVLFANITNADERELIDRQKKGATYAEASEWASDALDKAREQAMQALDTQNTDTLNNIESPRIAAIFQASRVLKPGGILIARGIEEEETELLNAFGLELVMHTPSEWNDYEAYGLGKSRGGIGEAVFQKPAAE